MFDFARYRTYDGGHNNPEAGRGNWGRAGNTLARRADPDYADGYSALAVRGPANPNPRDISNLLCMQPDTESHQEPNGFSDYMWAWGQFVDHELDLTGESEEPDDRLNSIHVAAGDPQLPGEGVIPFVRSEAVAGTGTAVGNPREQANKLSAYLDATNVYGNNETRAAALRRFDGTGRLKTTETPQGEMLPYNLPGLANAAPGPVEPASYFLAGDVRANEHAVLTSMHTLFVREHNWWCTELPRRFPELAGDDEATYQFARKVVGALEQVVTYREFLPKLIGADAIPDYTHDDPDKRAEIFTEFSTACYRLGHSMLSNVLRIGSRGSTLGLRNAFFQPHLVSGMGIDPFLEGLFQQPMQQVDIKIVDSVRSFLFGPPNPVTSTLLDLAALNIQRGRDHGLPGYNAVRVAFGLKRYGSFAEITDDVGLQDNLRTLYQEVDHIDPWIGALAEKPAPGAIVGELIRAVLAEQFTCIRDGDRFWYANDEELVDAGLVPELEAIRLSDIVRWNTRVRNVPTDIFTASS
jgi:hypothetical protein